MTRRKSRGGKTAPWTDQRGRWGHRSRAYERRDRDGAIWIDVVDPDPAGQGRRVRKLLPGAPATVRDADGNLDHDLIVLAEQAHVAFVKLLEQTRRLPDRGGPSVGTPTVSALTPTSGAPESTTLRSGFDAWLSLSSGRFPTKNRRWKAIEHAANTLCRDIGPMVPWSALSPTVVRTYWRELARQSRRSGGAGMRRAEIILDALYSVGAWLRKQELLPSDVGRAPEQWRRDLKDDWTEITGRGIEPKRPRHSPEEVRTLFGALDDPRVDPRMALLFELAAEQRLGQAARAMRSALELPDVDADAPDGRHGFLRLRGQGRKLAASIALSAKQRARIDRALTTGYLRELEDAYRRGELADYALFPEERLKAGVVPYTATISRRPMRPERIRYLFKRLEQIAGVTSVPGRGWYGVRRTATDLAQDVATDDRVLNAISGHADSRTRELIYQERHRHADLIAAAPVRERLRGRAKSTGSTEDTATRLRTEIARLQRALEQLDGP